MAGESTLLCLDGLGQRQMNPLSAHPSVLGPGSIALYHELPCSPCLTNTSGKTSSCRLPACILAIDVDEVVTAACSVLGTPQESGREVAR